MFVTGLSMQCFTLPPAENHIFYWFLTYFSTDFTSILIFYFSILLLWLSLCGYAGCSLEVKVDDIGIKTEADHSDVIDRSNGDRPNTGMSSFDDAMSMLWHAKPYELAKMRTDRFKKSFIPYRLASYQWYFIFCNAIVCLQIHVIVLVLFIRIYFPLF